MENQIKSVIFENIIKIKPSIQRSNLSETTSLFGSESELDSLDLINLIVSIEKELFTQLNIEVTLADDQALSQEVSPFTSVRTLVDYIQKIINK
jgi:acyl carrier protein